MLDIYSLTRYYFGSFLLLLCQFFSFWLLLRCFDIYPSLISFVSCKLLLALKLELLFSKHINITSFTLPSYLYIY